MTNKIPQRHDALAKGFLSDPTVAREFLELYLSADVKGICNFDTLQIEPTSYIDEDLKMHCADITYRLELKDKTNFVYVYTLVEHQSTPVALMPFRILKYQVAIIQNHLTRYEHKNNKKNPILPLVVPIVFYNGTDSPYPCKVDIAEMFEHRDLFDKIQLGRFKLVDLTITNNEEILKHGKVAVLEMLAKHISVRDFSIVKDYIMSALVAGHNDHLSELLFKIAYAYLSTARENDELLELSDEIIKQLPNYKEIVMTHTETLLQKGIQQGMQQGRQEGRQEGVEEGIYKAGKEIAKNLLKSGVDINTIKNATYLSDAELAELKDLLH